MIAGSVIDSALVWHRTGAQQRSRRARRAGNGCGRSALRANRRNGHPPPLSKPLRLRWVGDHTPTRRPPHVCLAAIPIRFSQEITHHPSRQSPDGRSAGRYSTSSGRRCFTACPTKKGDSLSPTLLQWCHARTRRRRVLDVSDQVTQQRPPLLPPPPYVFPADGAIVDQK